MQSGQENDRYVAPEHRGQNVGSKLENSAPSLGVDSTSVWSFPRSIQLFFRQVDVQKPGSQKEDAHDEKNILKRYWSNSI